MVDGVAAAPGLGRCLQRPAAIHQGEKWRACRGEASRANESRCILGRGSQRGSFFLSFVYFCWVRLLSNFNQVEPLTFLQPILTKLLMLSVALGARNTAAGKQPPPPSSGSLQSTSLFMGFKKCQGIQSTSRGRNFPRRF